MCFYLYKYWCYKEYIDTLQKSRIYQIIDYHILLGMLENLQKNHKSKILSSEWVVDIKKWFKRWDMEDLLELPSDDMKYVVIEEILTE